MRFLLALARAQAVPLALGLSVSLVVAEGFLGGQLLSVPFLQEAVRTGRIFPALLAGCGALVVAADWSEYEVVGTRSVAVLVLGRWFAGTCVAIAPAYLAVMTLTTVVLLYLLLALVATVLPRHWWLLLPPLLYLQLYLPADLLPQ